MKFFSLVVLSTVVHAKSFVGEGKNDFCIPHIVQKTYMHCYQIKNGHPICADGNLYDQSQSITKELNQTFAPSLGTMKDGTPRMEFVSECAGRQCMIRIHVMDRSIKQLIECGVGPIPHVEQDPNQSPAGSQIH